MNKYNIKQILYAIKYRRCSLELYTVIIESIKIYQDKFVVYENAEAIRFNEEELFLTQEEALTHLQNEIDKLWENTNE